ncbi:MAG TPA: serine/threonine-protein kinase, partial [Nannocystaceae bacterium]|nr:serine/threonine-protein kinase [Nannocystaceae bacterium]
MATRPPSRSPDVAASPGRTAVAAAEVGDSPSRKLREAMAARLATLDDLSGEVLADRYALRRQIGRGGMGAVYLAEHVLIHKPVAVKVLGFEHSRRPRDIERFLQEARSASKIRNENIVDITDFGYTPEGLAFLVMEYLDGEDLAVTCAREKRLQWPRVVAIGRQICAALEAAHGEGIIHRDMKLENCFRIRRGDNEDFIKVLDFGIAKVVDDDYDPNARAMTGSALVGTPEYVSPELVRGLKSDARADIYAVGVILYKLLTGEVPLRGESYMATLTKQILEPPVPPRQRAPDAGIPADLEAIVMHALEKEPERRFQTIQEMGAALAKVGGGASRVGGVGTALLPAVPPATQRRLWLALTVASLVLVAVGALVAYLLLRTPPAEPSEVIAAAPVQEP